MAETLAKNILISYLGEYLQDIDSEKMCVGLWSGSLSLQNLKLKSSAFEKLNFPIKILFGKIGKLDVFSFVF